MFSDPLKNLKAFDIRETDVVADLGAGTGFYTIPAAQEARGGKVYAVEIGRDMLQTVRNKARDAKLTNVEFLDGDVEKPGGTKISDGVLDKVIASNILFQVLDKNIFVSEINRILKVGGEVLLIDWSEDSILPTSGGAVYKKAARDMFEKKGFILEREIDAGAHHYGMIFKKG